MDDLSQDVSGSMASDNKLSQAKVAMVDIVSRLNPGDVFTIVLFETTATTWQPQLVSVSNVAAAITYINCMCFMFFSLLKAVFSAKSTGWNKSQ